MPRTTDRALRESAFTHELLPLVRAVAERRVILFVGGGVSQNLGLPEFGALVGHMAADLGFATGTYKVADYALIAEAYLVKHAQLGGLRSWMDAAWHPPTIRIARSELHKLIVDLDFPIIYTTNYDRWLEKSFEARRKPFHKITNAADLTVGAINFDHHQPARLEIAREARAIRAGAFDPDAGDRTERVQPIVQLSEPDGRCRERLDSEHTAVRVERGSDMVVEVGVDSTHDRARRIYDGHCHPFSLKRLGDGTHVPGRRPCRDGC